MVSRNAHFSKVSSNYLFPEINRRKKLFLEQNPGASLISLGIGDTTQPLAKCVVDSFISAAQHLGTVAGYNGYGPEQGQEALRIKISQHLYHGKIAPEDIFISDGAKCDIGRLQMLFGNKISVAIQDPAYPVYVDGSLLQGVSTIVPLPCTSENNFWPDFTKVPRSDIIYWCSPNNPTGTVNTREQLQQLVDFAKANRSIILFDAAYAGYVSDEKLPRSIYEIPGAEDVAIEIGSFSKLAGFSGVRLGWTIVPKTLKYEDGQLVHPDWKRLVSTIFNGASNLAQQGGIAALTTEGMKEISHLIRFYMENTALIKSALIKKYEVFGGVHAPYLWVKFPHKNSWDAFQEILETKHIITTPGSGFGPGGESYLRFSAFGHRQTIIEAVSRLV